MRAPIVDAMLGRNRDDAFMLIQRSARSRMKQEAIETVARGHGFKVPDIKRWYTWKLRNKRRK